MDPPVAERVDPHSSVVVLVDIHHGQGRHRTIEQETGQDGLALRQSGGDGCLRRSLLVMGRIPLQENTYDPFWIRSSIMGCNSLRRHVLAPRTNSERRKHPNRGAMNTVVHYGSVATAVCTRRDVPWPPVVDVLPVHANTSAAP